MGREEKEKEGSVTREESKSERLLPHGEGYGYGCCQSPVSA